MNKKTIAIIPFLFILFLSGCTENITGNEIFNTEQENNKKICITQSDFNCTNWSSCEYDYISNSLSQSRNCTPINCIDDPNLVTLLDIGSEKQSCEITKEITIGESIEIKNISITAKEVFISEDIYLGEYTVYDGKYLVLNLTIKNNGDKEISLINFFTEFLIENINSEEANQYESTYLLSLPSDWSYDGTIYPKVTKNILTVWEITELLGNQYWTKLDGFNYGFPLGYIIKIAFSKNDIANKNLTTRVNDETTNIDTELLKLIEALESEWT